ncbi:MAG: serine/threonine protein kinase [Sandaracinaceae bacterium]|nr:serine/threonine protein kinase [Sandaracinaceae bacterium]
MAFAVGDIVGGCEIVARLKAGGMATLYLARRQGVSGFSRRVAIKVVHDHLAEDESFVRMFVNEALLQSRISHPNVVHVEELGREGDQHFLVMEYVHGCSLSQLLKELAKRDRGLPPELAVSIAIQVLAGLHAAHEVRDESGRSAGVVHRDVSPDNALLSFDGHVKLIDFGIAKVQSHATQTGGQLKGKLRYMSPEQASGGVVDRTTDIYALGIVLWEMLTMRRLFTAEDQFQLLESVRNPMVPRPSMIRAGVPPAVEAVVMRALSLRPEDRWPSAHEFRRALVEACPGAMLADASQLAELLSVALPDQVANGERLLGSGSTSLPPAPHVEPDDAALATMTISATGLEFLGASDPSQSSGEEGQPAAAAHTPSVSATYVPAEPITRGDAPADRKLTIPRRALVAVTVVAALVALVAGVTFGTIVSSRMIEPSEISATPLTARDEPTSPGTASPEPVDEAPVPTTAAAPPAEPPAVPTAVEPPAAEPPVEPPAVEPPAVEPVAERAPDPEPAPRPARRAPRPRPVTRPAGSGRRVPLADEF